MIARECNCSIELGSSGKHMEYCPMHPAYAKREPQRDDGRKVERTAIKPALPKWQYRNWSNAAHVGAVVTMHVEDRTVLQTFGKPGDIDFAIVPWADAQEFYRQPTQFEVEPGHFANVETMTISDLARRVLLTPDASREQVLDRVDALMKEPRSIAARDTLRAEKAIANQHASNMRLERALDDIATLETRLQESRLVIADQAFMINRMNRKGTK